MEELTHAHRKILRFLKKGQYSVEELAELTFFSQQTIRGRMAEMKRLGYAIEAIKSDGENKRYYIPAKPLEKQTSVLRHTGSTHYRIALLSDTHLGAETEDLDSLHKFYQIAKEKGVREFYHSGDLTDGTGVYPGQIAGLKVFTGMKQVEYAAANYPELQGCKSYFICGNHDLKLMEREDIDVGPMIATRRPDMVYLGQYEANVYFEKASLRLIHPDGGMPYAMSYRLQKYVENIAGGTKPNIISMGHLHQSLYAEIRNIHCFLPGSFQRQNNFLRRKGVDPQISAWIIDFNLVNKTIDGVKITEVNNLKTEKIRFY